MSGRCLHATLGRGFWDVQTLGEYSDLAALKRWKVGAVIPDGVYAALRENPRYSEVVRTFAAAMLAAGDADPVLDGILKDAGRNAGAMCVAHLHFSGGLTLPRLKALCASFGLVSPGRARALLLYLRYLGYVELANKRGHGSPAVYRPTAGFLCTWRTHLRAVIQAVRGLEPAVDVILERYDDAVVSDAYAQALCESFLEAVSHANVDTPYFRVFMHRHAGIQIVHAMLAANDGAFPPDRPIPLSVSATARRFRVSRIHIRRMFDDAERAGLAHVTKEGILWTQAGRDSIDYVFATQMIRYLDAAARTIARLDGPWDLPLSSHGPVMYVGEGASFAPD